MGWEPEEKGRERKGERGGEEETENKMKGVGNQE